MRIENLITLAYKNFAVNTPKTSITAKRQLIFTINKETTYFTVLALKNEGSSIEDFFFFIINFLLRLVHKF